MPLATVKKQTIIDQQYQYCTFWLSEWLFGVNIQEVKEINDEVIFTPIFHSAEAVKGYVNIRGQIHLIVDLRNVLGLKPGEITGKSCLVIFKSSVTENFGVLVDRIGDVIEVSSEQIENHETYEDKTMEIAGLGDIASGVCKLEEQLMVVLNAKNILKTIECIKKE